MQNLKQWVKDNQDLIAIGAFVTVCAAATTAIVIVTKNSVATHKTIASPYVAAANKIMKNPLPEQFQDHDYAGLLSVGQKGDLWAHPDGAKAFRTGQLDTANKRMFFGEYQYNGLPPQDVMDAAMAGENPPELVAPPVVEA